MVEKECENCKSKKIMKFRLDSDWAYGSGSYSTVNGDHHYTETELNYDATDRPDIEIYHCLACDHLFE